jgi:hypothetical protein
VFTTREYSTKEPLLQQTVKVSIKCYRKTVDMKNKILKKKKEKGSERSVV